MLGLAGCANSDEPDSPAADDSSVTVAPEDSSAADQQVDDAAASMSVAAVLAAYQDCVALEPLLGDAISGLTLDSESSEADAEAIHCSWMPIDVTTANIATVGVDVDPSSGEVSTPESISDAGLERVEEPAVDAAGGIAYSLDLGAMTASTVVEVPGVTVSIAQSVLGQGEVTLTGAVAAGIGASILGLR